MRKKLVPEEKPIYNAVNVFRERGNYLQRLEQFEKGIHAYNEALRWNNTDVPSLLGRCLARSKSTHYAGALADVAYAAELDPERMTTMQIRAQIEYEKCAFERALVLAHQGHWIRQLPLDFAECKRSAEETIRQCTGKTAIKILSSVKEVQKDVEFRNQRKSSDRNAPNTIKHTRRLDKMRTSANVKEMSLAEKQKFDHISHLMSSKYLGRMAQDKYFLISLCKDERLMSANKQSSSALQTIANKALHDIEKRQAVLRERCPLYAARATEAEARARLASTRKAHITQTQKQNTATAKRLIKQVGQLLEERDTSKCVEQAEFAMEQISRKPVILLPGKDKYLQILQSFVANAFLDQKRVRISMSEVERETRAYILLGLYTDPPAHDSIINALPGPRRDPKRRLRAIERALSMSVRATERMYLLHELARLLIDTKQGARARFYASKCHAEARAANDHIWMLNAAFLLARCHIIKNNRPEARVVLLEAASLARSDEMEDIAGFYETCASVALDGDVDDSNDIIEKREKEMVNIMQDDDLRSQAKHLFKRMSVVPASRRFSIMPGAHVEDKVPMTAANRRISIMPKTQQATKIPKKFNLPLGFQEFDMY